MVLRNTSGTIFLLMVTRPRFGTGRLAISRRREIELEDIPRAGRLMYLTAVLALVVFGAGKALLIVL